MDLKLEGKKAFITGGTHGIGLAIANFLLKEHCIVGVCSRHAPAYGTLNYQIVKWLCDVSDPKEIADVMQNIIGQWRTVDILINNVGGGGRWGNVFEDTDEQIYTEVYTKNAMAAVRFTKLAVPYMIKQKWGRVVTIASMHGKEAGGNSWFNMAKSAEISLMKTLAVNSKPEDGVTFNSVAPGYISIPGNNNTFPSQRVGSAEDVAAAVAFLCSEQAKFINGACISIDGGESKSF